MDRVELALMSADEIFLQLRRYFFMLNHKAEDLRNTAKRVTQCFLSLKRDPYNKSLLDDASQIVMNSSDKIKNDRISVACLKAMTEKIFRDNSKHPITGLSILVNIAEMEVQQLNVLTGKRSKNEKNQQTMEFKNKDRQPSTTNEGKNMQVNIELRKNEDHQIASQPNGLYETVEKPVLPSCSPSHLTSPSTSYIHDSTVSRPGVHTISGSGINDCSGDTDNIYDGSGGSGGVIHQTASIIAGEGLHIPPQPLSDLSGPSQHTMRLVDLKQYSSH